MQVDQGTAAGRPVGLTVTVAVDRDPDPVDLDGQTGVSEQNPFHLV